MRIAGVIPQIRTTDLAGSIRFCTETVGLTLEFQYEDFYAGIQAGGQVFHQARRSEGSIGRLRRPGRPLPPLPRDRRRGGRGGGADETRDRPRDGFARHAWGTREFVIKDDQGHTLYFGQHLKTGGG